MIQIDSKEYRLSEFIFFGHDKYQSMASESTQTPALIQPREWEKENYTLILF